MHDVVAEEVAKALGSGPNVYLNSPNVVHTQADRAPKQITFQPRRNLQTQLLYHPTKKQYLTN